MSERTYMGGRRGSDRYPTPTLRCIEIFRYIFDFTAREGYQPTLRTVAAHFKLGSASSVLGFLKSLQGYAYVDLEHGKGRSVRFLKTPDGEPFRGFIHKPIEAPGPGA